MSNLIPATLLSRRHATLSLGAALLAVGLPACAHEALSRAAPVAVSVIDRDTGMPLSVYRKDGRAYVAGKPASRYAIRLNNQTGGRVLVVLSVDGINVISGETAGVGQTGYVLSPWQSYDIAGWRKSDSAIAAFEFAALEASYAAQTGRPANVGVIGAAMFLEKPAAPPPLPQSLPPSPARSPDARIGSMGSTDQRAENKSPISAGAPAAPTPAGAVAAAKAAQAESMAAAKAAPDDRRSSVMQDAEPRADNRPDKLSERLGTAHGQREWSVTTRTAFERLSSSPQATVEIAYDSWARLVAAGVVAMPVTAGAQARAFPSDDGRGFVPDPPLR